MRARLTYANVMSSLAVFIALSGTSYAATKLAKGSVKGQAIATGAVTSAKVKNGSLLAKDFKAGQLRAGRAGADGAPGAAGAAGPPGAPGATGGAGLSALGPLPSGATMTGAGLLSDRTDVAVQVRTFSAFPIRLAQPLKESAPRQIFFGLTAEEDSSAYAPGNLDPRCTGTTIAPSAPPGLLCAYVSGASAVGAGTLSIRAGTFGIGDDIANDLGFQVAAVSTGTGLGVASVQYTWAYTAP